ncbi:MAG: thiamine-phosphate kinase [Actinobacteria bacterium]|nr:thiamine-phosphate kinase [Actinomycetota bacterium]
MAGFADWGEGAPHADEDDLMRALADIVGGEAHGASGGIGDDAAVIVPDLIWTVDAQVDGVHFRRDLSSPADVGWKALAVSVSDCAAMGATPVGALVSLVIAEGDVTSLEPIYVGLAECAEAYGCPVAGGDVARGPGLVLAVSVLGRTPVPAPGRGGARPGDLVVVTGDLGVSAAGLAALVDPALGDVPGVDACVERHRRPQPRLAEGAALARVARVMMDVSDGLATDLPRIARRSGVTLEADLDALPVPAPVRAVAARIGSESGAFAASGGEDYELVAVLDPADVAGCGVPLTVIGEVVAGPAEVRWRGAGSDAALRGWDHLAR